ncbi:MULTISPECIES: CpsB/CapC family capsule biosynthesis tyrosine phosphatase [Gemella]|uniref:CpsB/CapC family capsule biosynthesis tyrosine phosphatase n=1 Tax=Gemella TaxID=1378 RepID=UPI000ADE7F39|nr:MULTISPECIES: CpsB/CapC family capsule biosynthesis tyrosine phosphatase [Gemella]
MKDSHRMIDIHSHIVFGVDDGAKTKEDTEDLLRESFKQGVGTIIATPHRRRGMFEESIETIKENFKEVEKIAKNISEDLNVYLGSEIFYKEGELANIESRKYPTLAGTDYILVEFSYGISYREMYKALNGIILLGLSPVIAHIERYACLEKDLNHVQELINMGCYMQVNAASVLKTKLFGDKHKHYKKRAKKYLDGELVHFIASDMHNMTLRRPHMREAYDIIEKKYGTTVAYELFEKNAERLLMNKII